MNGKEFVKRVRDYAKANNIAFGYDPAHGKGSHGRLYLGSRFTTVKDLRKEIGPGLLNAMLGQIGIAKKDLGL
jgi:mRNA interferase HicA